MIPLEGRAGKKVWTWFVLEPKTAVLLTFWVWKYSRVGDPACLGMNAGQEQFEKSLGETWKINVVIRRRTQVRQAS